MIEQSTFKCGYAGPGECPACAEQRKKESEPAAPTGSERGTVGSLCGTIHHLKTWPEYFEQVQRGAKTFEIRKDDRGFSVGHALHLREFVPNRFAGGYYTGRELIAKVTYITDFGQPPGQVVMGIALINPQND